LAVIPCLLAPPKSFSTPVGGNGDAESAAYKVAVAEFDVLKSFYAYVKDGEADEVVVRALRARIEERAWGRGGDVGDVGGTIGTLEM
jgi:hypothetical protein